MFLKHHVILCGFFVFCRGNARVNFSKCGMHGFTCNIVESKTLITLTYQCPVSTKHALIMINQFNSPNNTESFIIQNCDELTISMSCSSEKKNIQSLYIQNIGKLSILPLPFQSHLPPKVVLENITYVESVPSFTFSQISDKSLHSTGCIVPQTDFSTIRLTNVSIETVQSNGFYMPRNFGDFIFNNVRINRMQSSAIIAGLSKTSQFLMESSIVDVAESLAFRVNGKNVIFRKNKFAEISPNGINGTMETFRFFKNSVYTLQPHAISIRAQNVFVTENRFQYLKSGAFEKISPGLITDVFGRNFATLEFVYEFNENNINFMDAGCLHPDFQAYEHVSSDMRFERNSVFCSCENSAWLVSETGHGYNTAPIESFYDTLLDEGNRNNCSYTCDLPIARTKMMIRDGKCMENVTTEWLCRNKNNTSSLITTTDQARQENLDLKSTSQAVIATAGLIVLVVLNEIF